MYLPSLVHDEFSEYKRYFGEGSLLTYTSRCNAQADHKGKWKIGKS